MQINLTTPKELNGLTSDAVHIVRTEEDEGSHMALWYKMYFEDANGNVHREWTQRLDLKDEGEDTHYSDVTDPNATASVNLQARYQKIIDLATWNVDGSLFSGTIV